MVLYNCKNNLEVLMARTPGRSAIKHNEASAYGGHGAWSKKDSVRKSLRLVKADKANWSFAEQVEEVITMRAS